MINVAIVIDQKLLYYSSLRLDYAAFVDLYQNLAQCTHKDNHIHTPINTSQMIAHHGVSLIKGESDQAAHG